MAGAFIRYIELPEDEFKQLTAERQKSKSTQP